MVKTISAAARRRQLFKEYNLKKIELYVPEHIKTQLKKAENALRCGSAFRILPPTDFTQQLMTTEGVKFMIDVSPWTAKTLFEEFAASDLLPVEGVKLSLIEGVSSYIEVDYINLDRKAIMIVEGEQILVSILICPVTEVTDSAAMNETLLKTHKFLPLSTIGITTINGTDFYELFGALSSRSLLNSVATEIMALEENYEEVVSAFIDLADAA